MKSVEGNIWQVSNRIRCVVAALLVLTIGMACDALKDHVLIKNFHAVEPGEIYRGAEQRPGPLRRIIERHQIRTIVCLVDPEPSEQAVATSLGVRWIGVPIAESSLAVTFETLEQLAEILAEPANRPVFFHCRRGIYRSNLAQAVYRMKRCGWTLDQALAELRAIGFDPDVRGGDQCCADVLEKYYVERIVTARGKVAGS